MVIKVGGLTKEAKNDTREKRGETGEEGELKGSDSRTEEQRDERREEGIEKDHVGKEESARDSSSTLHTDSTRQESGTREENTTGEGGREIGSDTRQKEEVGGKAEAAAGAHEGKHSSPGAQAAKSDVAWEADVAPEREAAGESKASGEAGAASGEAESASGEAESASGEAGPASGEAETASGEAGAASGEAESASGEAESASGEAGATSGGGVSDAAVIAVAECIRILTLRVSLSTLPALPGSASLFTSAPPLPPSSFPGQPRRTPAGALPCARRQRGVGRARTGGGGCGKKEGDKAREVAVVWSDSAVADADVDGSAADSAGGSPKKGPAGEGFLDLFSGFPGACSALRLFQSCLGALQPSPRVSRLLEEGALGETGAAAGRSEGEIKEGGGGRVKGGSRERLARSTAVYLEANQVMPGGTCGGCPEDPLLNCTLRALTWRYLRVPSNSSDVDFTVAAASATDAATVAGTFHPLRAPLLLPHTALAELLLLSWARGLIHSRPSVEALFIAAQGKHRASQSSSVGGDVGASAEAAAVRPLAAAFVKEESVCAAPRVARYAYFCPHMYWKAMGFVDQKYLQQMPRR
ncbi:unnamed protein product, partial [Closterium sp. NIES-65]